MGTQCKSESKLKPLEQKFLNQDAAEFLIGCFTYLINYLLIENQVVRDARYLQFSKKEKKSGLNVAAWFSMIIEKTLGNEAIQTYTGNGIKTLYDLCDKVKQEYTMYQMEKIAKSFIKKSDSCVKSKTHQQNTYWAEAYGLPGVEVYSEKNSYRRCNKYWFDVCNEIIL